MKLSSNTPNIRYGYALSKTKQDREAFPKIISAPSFCGGISNFTDDISSIGAKAITKKTGSFFKNIFPKIKDKLRHFIKNVFTEGTEVKYENRKEILEILKKNFGNTFNECIDKIDIYNNIADANRKKGLSGLFTRHLSSRGGKYTAFSYIDDLNENTITFHKDPFIKNVCEGFKEFTLGTALDIGVAIRGKFRKIYAGVGTNEVIASTAKKSSRINNILDNRIAQKKARDAFYKLSGIFEEATDGIDKIESRYITNNLKNMSREKIALIKDNIENLAKNSIKTASKKVGKYNTKNERAWNRLGTGLVSATFAAKDFHNISMLQNNDEEQANASGKKRFWQDMRRQGITAGITYLILGAFQSKVNKSMLYAVLSLGGVTLISEILSRKLGGIPLTPLSPEAAKKAAEKKERKEGLKNKDINNLSIKEKMQNIKNASADKIAQTKYTPAAFGNVGEKNPFSAFALKDDKLKNGLNFTSEPKKENEKDESPKKKKTPLLARIPEILLGIAGISLAVGFLRSRNIFKLDTKIKSMSAKYNDTVKKFKRRRLILPEKQVEGFMEFMKENGFDEQSKTLQVFIEQARKNSGPRGKLTGQSSIVRKYLPLREIDPNGIYYDFGDIHSKGKATVANVLLYPINTVVKLFKGANNITKKIFTGAAPAKEEVKKLSKDNAVSFLENYSKKFQKASSTNELYAFKEELQDAFTRHFSEANSKNKNTTLAMVSRFLITLITGYFFVNDYRNEVLIESKGEDIERANATMKERIGHKISNFFFNSMFMDIFNTTFENIYLSSVVGATAVAMATEFTNETAVRASICTPTKKMNRDELIEYENKRLNDKGIKGKYYRAFMKITGKKPLSAKVKKD